MTDLETRLRSLRMPSAAGPSPDQVRGCAARRRRRRRLAATGLSLAVIAVAVAVAWTVQAQSPERTVTGPADTTPNVTSGDPGDVRVEVSPRTGLEDGELVEVRVENLDQLPNAVIFQCAADETIEDPDPQARCDPSAVHKPEGSPGWVSAEEHQVVSLSRTIHIINDGSSDADSYTRPYDCATEPAGCVLVVAPWELPVRAVAVPLTFEDAEQPSPTVSISPAVDLHDNQEVAFTAEGLPPNSSFQIVLCHLDSENCEWELTEPPNVATAESDSNGSLATTINVRAAIYPNATIYPDDRVPGRIDCVVEQCAVTLAGTGESFLHAPLQFAAGVEASVPQLRIDPPGPYTDRQQVTIHGAGFPPGISPRLARCPDPEVVDIMEGGCTAPLGDVSAEEPIVDANGEFTTTVRLGAYDSVVRDLCFATQCIVGWALPKGPIVPSTVTPVDFLAEEDPAG